MTGKSCIIFAAYKCTQASVLKSAGLSCCASHVPFYLIHFTPIIKLNPTLTLHLYCSCYSSSSGIMVY
ncbi:hypothetical protein RJT34_08886 [Clitoria ternatea]|uniref:Uncharacterized protein n=1 Tax=Clitoria ternatea TaxID=43366 RepID=A0AAN9PUW0_CLITE